MLKKFVLKLNLLKLDALAQPQPQFLNLNLKAQSSMLKLNKSLSCWMGPSCFLAFVNDTFRPLARAHRFVNATMIHSGAHT